MKTRLLLAMTCMAALAACNSNKDSSNASNATTTTSSNGAAAAPADNAAAGRTVDPNLAQEMALAVNMLKPQLPLRQGPVTITNLEANGAEIIHTMEVPQDLTEETFQRFRDQLPVQACANAQMRRLLERGGTTTYKIRDSGGEEFTASVSTCS
jgi:hypothetical protein